MTMVNFPDFPRTRHLPWKPNSVRGDLVASDAEARVIFDSELVVTEEKIDGANCGMMLLDNQAVIRNRNHILSKGYQKSTPAKIQFRHSWNWFYENEEQFARLNAACGGPVGVYGEWLYALHGVEYDKLPALFVAFDVYDPELGECLPSHSARQLLTSAGFAVAPLLHAGPVKNWQQLEAFCGERSPYSSNDLCEGVYVKVSDHRSVTHRFKMVRQGFVQGSRWNTKALVKNKLGV